MVANFSIGSVAQIGQLRELHSRLEQARLDLAAFRDPHRDNQNAFFLCLMALFIFLMQCGFAFLEAGAVRAKNVTNILTKNVLDSLLTIVSYWSVGWALAYGPNSLGQPLSSLFGLSQFFGHGLSNVARFFFQYVFAARTSTIVSGSVAERAEFSTFIVYSLLVPALVYPLLSHWGWSESGWLRRGIQMDADFHTTYLDFAGAGLVHLCGGTIALVAAWMMGPRIGRFSRRTGGRRRTNPIPGHSVPLASLGGFILMLGFLAFNGGSVADIVQAGNGQLVARAMVNTLMCGAFAALITLLVHKVRHDKWTVLLTINACLAGMIASCAGCNQMDSWGTVLTGLGGGLIYLGLSELAIRAGLDDPLDAFAVHAGGGFWGLFSVCLVSNQPGRGLLPALARLDPVLIEHSMAQLGWNLLAALAIILWSALAVVPAFGLLMLVHKFRVPANIERKGIDIWKHGEEAYPLTAYGHGWDELEAEQKDWHPVATVWHDPDRYERGQPIAGEGDGGRQRRHNNGMGQKDGLQWTSAKEDEFW